MSWLPKPLSNFSNLPGLSFLFSMNQKYGGAPTNTPPRPTSKPVARSNALGEILAFGEDGPLVADAGAFGVLENHDAIARHFALGGVRFGYSKHSITHTRPFSSTVIATGLTTCGSAANSLTSKPG